MITSSLEDRKAFQSCFYKNFLSNAPASSSPCACVSFNRNLVKSSHKSHKKWLDRPIIVGQNSLWNRIRICLISYSFSSDCFISDQKIRIWLKKVMMSPSQACSASSSSRKFFFAFFAFSARLEKFQLGSRNLQLNSPKRKKILLDSLKLKCQRSACFGYEPFSWLGKFPLLPCPSMRPKQFWSVQNGFCLTKLIWTWP